MSLESLAPQVQHEQLLFQPTVPSSNLLLPPPWLYLMNTGLQPKYTSL
jgi:hypothetical protein